MLRYTVDDMTCGHCVQSITAAVHDVAPNATVTVDLASKTVEVAEATSPQAVEAAIQKAGYTPKTAGDATLTTGSCCGHC